ncbi:MAG: DNA polymerase [Planctomycetaceae bacterium]
MLDQFGEIWLVDFEFYAPPGERPTPLCLVGRELRSNKLVRVWLDNPPESPPFDTGAASLFVAYFASAEFGCFLSLGWSLPERVLDLYCEFRNSTNGVPTPRGNGLLGALAAHGLDSIESAEKGDMRALAMRGGDYTSDERAALLDYCQTDVDALVRLLPAMATTISINHALLRGRYMKAVAAMEHNGVPIDTDKLNQFREHWTTIQGRLIAAVDANYGVYVPTNSAFNPSTQFGKAVAVEAAEWEIDPHELADAAVMAWNRNTEAEQAFLTAKISARQVTSLTPTRLNRWEDAGHDCSTWPGLDADARELAAMHPELGIGRGYESDTNDSATDYAASLWEVLRDDRDAVLPKHSPEILREAAESVYNGGDLGKLVSPMTFKADRWAAYLSEQGIPWPRLETGRLALDDDTFRQMARQYPEQIGPIRELRHTLGQMRLNELSVGSDGRNRCLLSPFRSRTGRNQPSNSKFIFGPSAWLRSLIKPAPGRAIAYVDWSQQEFAIAAALSGDQNMIEAYASSDPYLAFAKQAGAVPDDATQQSHPLERGQYKICALAVQYGMGETSLAGSLGEPEIVGRELLRTHKRTYPDFWKWSQAATDHAMLFKSLNTVFGWNLFVGTDANPRSLANFPCQANGAEMLRLACCLIVERGIKLLAPIHDAVLIEADADDIDDTVAATQDAMREAGAIVLDGFSLRTDVDVVAYPDRYSDARGAVMWQRVTDILEKLEPEPRSPVTHPPRSCVNGVPRSPVAPPPSLIKSLIGESI